MKIYILIWQTNQAKGNERVFLLVKTEYFRFGENNQVFCKREARHRGRINYHYRYFCHVVKQGSKDEARFVRGAPIQILIGGSVA
jgi:hypothetical protein